ncbi:MAG: NYN domain-containing protein [Syntrophales bacterium]|nr:NYN domain-containing protein [Syntrophales bacterium]
MHIIIDGYNLIRQSDSLGRFESISLESGRNELIRRVLLYKKSRGHRITIVFDGWASDPLTEERDREGGIDIIYSRKGEKADEVIKRMAKKGEEEIVVVTSDRSIADSISRSCGVAISSPEFEAKMERTSEYDFAPSDSADQHSCIFLGTHKKGPSRRISRKERAVLKRTKKL